MKRCKACTTRAAGAVWCTLLDEHEGAHEGEHVENGARIRAVWNDPNAPYFEPVGAEPIGLTNERSAMADATAQAAAAFRSLAAAAPSPSKATHCHCGAEHDRALDPSLRTLGAAPLAAFKDTELADSFYWPLVCRECGVVYCALIRTL